MTSREKAAAAAGNGAWRVMLVPPSVLTRRELWVQVALVLITFPLAATILAGASLTSELLTGTNFVRLPVVIPFHATLSYVLRTIAVLSYYAAVPLLVWYMLRSDGGLAAIGLTHRRLVPALGSAALLTIVARLADHAGAIFPPPFTQPSVTAAVSLPWTALLYYGARAISAGVVEEMVVLGFLTTRLRQVGSSPMTALLLSLLVRTSYHLEYGWQALGVAAFGLVLSLFYFRTRLLLPVILAHAAADLAIVLSAVSFHW